MPRDFLYTHVDDGCVVIADKCEELINNILTVLPGRNAGPARLVLRMLVKQDHEARTITLSQGVIVKEAVRRYHLHGSARSKCPLLPEARLGTDAPPLSHAHAAEFRSIVGTVLYIASMTRPDITFAATLLSQYMAAPTQLHIDAAHKTLLYLKGTASLKLVRDSPSFHPAGIPIPSPGEQHLLIYSDSDWATCPADRWSVSGFAFTFYGGPVIWATKKQPCIGKSTMAAEDMAASSASVDTLALIKLIQDDTKTVIAPVHVPLLCDKIAATKVLVNPVE